MKKGKGKEKEKIDDPSIVTCPDCGKSYKRMVPICARCKGEAFFLTLDPHDGTLYCDCAECGFKVVAFPIDMETFIVQQMGGEEEGLEHMSAEGNA